MYFKTIKMQMPILLAKQTMMSKFTSSFMHYFDRPSVMIIETAYKTRRIGGITAKCISQR